MWRRREIKFQNHSHKRPSDRLHLDYRITLLPLDTYIDIMNTAQRVSSATSFILQSPPGEINDIISDLRTIVDDDEALQTGIQPALEEYNKQQFVCVAVPGQDHQVRVTKMEPFIN